MALRLLLMAVLLGYCLAGLTKQASSKDMKHKQPDLSSEYGFIWQTVVIRENFKIRPFPRADPGTTEPARVGAQTFT